MDPKPVDLMPQEPKTFEAATVPQMPGATDSAENPRDVVDRRAGLDRRQKSAADAGYAGPDRRVGSRAEGRRTGLERRRGAGIRREEDRRSAEEGEMTAEQFEFVMAIETYKKVNKKLFPTWTEVLEVITQLGYKKVEARTLKLENVPEAPVQPFTQIPVQKVA
ncbi:MAG: hypothetical protein H7144_02370 [Burkholderiales bacterium]|nr:hypothetical protein [Phycisphaerae bacterium]